MTDKQTPTDAELKAMWRLHAADIGGIFCYARAVLAKWGTPAGAEEPQPSAEGPPEVWLQLHCDCLPHERTEPVDYTSGDVTWCWHAIHSDDVRYVRADLAATPQPTQAQAGAVTDAQVLAAVRVVSPGLFRHGLQPLPNDGANTAAQMRKEADTARKMLEAAHGIKGGQHDTE